MNRTLMLLWAGIAAVLLSGFSYSEQSVRASWIWQSGWAEEKSEEIVSFSRSKNMNLIYLRVDRQRPPEAYRDFIREANAAGIAVHATGGHPAWGLSTHQSYITQLVQWVHDYNRAVEDEARIRGIHLNVAPYLLPEWDRDREAVISSWQSNMEQFLAETGSELDTSATLSFWLGSTPGAEASGAFIDWMLEQFDHITVLAYRDKAEGPNGIMDVSRDLLERAERVGGSVVIAVNTRPEELNYVSFSERGPAALSDQLHLVEEQWGERAAFAGLAIHDYAHWNEMSPTERVDEPIQGTYIWHAELLISEADEIIAFAQEKELNLIYARLDLTQPYLAYREFVRKAKESGIEVHALGGHPRWGTLEHQPYINNLIRYVKGFNQNMEESAQFDGIHLDIEPYVMREWHVDRESILQEWMDNIRFFVSETKKDSDLEVSADMAMWFDDIPTPGQPDTFFNEWMIQQLDHVTVMAFRDHLDGPGGIIEMTRNEIEYAQQHNKKLLIAVEMKEIPETRFISYFEEGEALMLEHREQLLEVWGLYDAYKGHVVHAYKYWKNAKE